METVVDSRLQRFFVVLCLGSAAFLSMVHVSMLSPLLKAISQEFGVPIATSGQLATVESAASGITALLIAPYLDSFSKKTLLKAQCLVTGIGMVMSMVSPNFWILAVGRIVVGIGSAVIVATCLALCGEIFDSADRRNWALGIVTSAVTLGAVLGLPITTLIEGAFGWRVAIIHHAPVIILILATLKFVPMVERSLKSQKPDGWIKSYREILTQRAVISVLLSLLILYVSWYGSMLYFSAFAKSEFHLSDKNLSSIFLLAGLCQVFANNFTPVVIKKIEPRSVIQIASFVLLLNLLLVSFHGSNTWLLYPFFAINNFTATVIYLAASIMLMGIDEERRGAIMTLSSATFGMGSAAGSAFFGFLLATTGEFRYGYLGSAMLVLLLFPALALSKKNFFKSGPSFAENVSE